MYGLVTRKQITNDNFICSPDAWVNQHKISPDKALEVMTLGGAYAVSMENYTGSLEEGKFADLIIASANPLTIAPDDIKDITVLLTMVDGLVQYQRQDYILKDYNIINSSTSFSSLISNTSSSTKLSSVTDTIVDTTNFNSTDSISLDTTIIFVTMVLFGTRRIRRH